jgi:hypothetical protein
MELSCLFGEKTVGYAYKQDLIRYLRRQFGMMSVEKKIEFVKKTAEGAFDTLTLVQGLGAEEVRKILFKSKDNSKTCLEHDHNSPDGLWHDKVGWIALREVFSMIFGEELDSHSLELQVHAHSPVTTEYEKRIYCAKSMEIADELVILSMMSQSSVNGVRKLLLRARKSYDTKYPVVNGSDREWRVKTDWESMNVAFKEELGEDLEVKAVGGEER